MEIDLSKVSSTTLENIIKTSKEAMGPFRTLGDQYHTQKAYTNIMEKVSKSQGTTVLGKRRPRQKRVRRRNAQVAQSGNKLTT